MQSQQNTTPKKTWPLMLGAIGVVFGDIGTSPLYTLKEAFGPHFGLVPDIENILGVLSLIFWSLIMIVTVKYVMIIMRADNKGEGGILALMALVQRSLPINAPVTYFIGILGVFGTALFFGDGVITPAMSVLSAVEGLNVAAPSLSKFVVPITLAIILLLFAFQRYGTDKVGKIFGPITLVWFLALGLLGLLELIRHPHVLKALNPYWAYHFFATHGHLAWLALGAIVLAVTGAEALYADMGHFGRNPIRLGWMLIVLPALTLNYFGQGAFLLANPAGVANPFYMLVPKSLAMPMVFLATAATVIASQALISGMYSVVRQGIQLGYLPRMRISHTSSENEGQIYIPMVNWSLMISVMVVVVGFGSSSALAVAYGVSVTGTMLLSAVLILLVAKMRWNVPNSILIPSALVIFVIDLAFLSSNLVKFTEGAWFPIALAVVVFTVMRTWRHGRDLVREQVNRDSLRIEHFVKSVMVDPPVRVPGTAIFMTPSNDYLPPAMLHNLKHNKVLHTHNILLSVETLSVPRADKDERYAMSDLGSGFIRLNLRYGYMEDPDVPKSLKQLQIPGLVFDPMDTTYFASREALTAKADQGMVLWRDKVFLFMSRNATPATEFFGIPGERLVELGMKVVI